MYDIESLLDEAAKQLGVDRDEIEWYSWPQSFPSTSGPRGGAGGQAFTTFQVFGFESYNGRIKACCGIWKKWDGLFCDKW